MKDFKTLFYSKQEKHLMFKGILLFCFVVLNFGCNTKKVPIRLDPRQVQIVSAQWFESEQVAYYFFRVIGRAPMGQSPNLEWAVDWPPEMAKPTEQYQSINFAEGVYSHRLVNCGEDLCGSFSFLAPKAPKQLHLRMKYNPGSTMSFNSSADFSIHPNDKTAQAFSALVYGVFDEKNQRIQLVSLPHFGTPSAEAIESFGFDRIYKVSEMEGFDLTTAEAKSLSLKSQSNTLFPIADCSLVNPNLEHLKIEKNGFQTIASKSWINADLSHLNLKSTVCFKVDFIDREGKSRVQSMALARKNPEIKSENLVLSTPLKPALKIPVVLSYCVANSGLTAPLWSSDFLTYQKFVLGFPEATLDLCFKVGEEVPFREKLKMLLLEKLKNAKSNNLSLRDFIFTVALNHKLNSEFNFFQEILAEELSILIESEKNMISPRLIGSFVYDSDANFKSQKWQNIIWCPRAIDVNQAGAQHFDKGVNCMEDHGGEYKSSLLNFLVPMGPFPNLTTYEDYRLKYHDKGQTKNPNFQVHSVTTSGLTVQSETQATTYIEGQSLHIGPSEALRFCNEGDTDNILGSLSFIKGEALASKAYNSSELSTKVNTEPAEGNYLVGINWDYPFYGMLEYDFPVTGKLFGFVPFASEGKAHRKLGDGVWLRPSWNIGPLIQKCQRFCEHPYFDDSGVYQLNERWQNPNGRNCIHSVYPKLESSL